VRVGDCVTKYQRSGAGRPVLVLHDAVDGDGVWPDVLGTLARRARVIEPHCDGNANGTVSAFVTWLEHFCEGIGAERLTLIASRRHALPALQFAMLEPECVEGLVIVTDGTSEELAIAGALAPERGEARVPLLVLNREQPAQLAADALAAFIDKTDATTG
jgi:pimeloyl-ACP methyl ester carboxylesterase